MIKRDVDVLVAGSGVSGAAAAIVSARQGLRICLIEKESFTGGIGFAGLLTNICGLYLNGDIAPTETLNKGLAQEIVALLHKLSPDRTVKKIGRVYVLPYSRDELRSVFDQLFCAEPDLDVHLDTSVVSVNKKEEKITGITVENSGKRYDIVPAVAIDCTGNGEVSAMAGAGFDLSLPEERQLAGYILRIKGIRDFGETLQVKVPFYMAEAVEKKRLSPFLRFSTLSHGDDMDEGYLKISLAADDTMSKEDAGSEALSVHRYLAERLEQFKDSYIAETSQAVMQREGRRIRGEYTLTEEDILNAKKFPDGIVKNSWPIEIWDRNKGTIYKYVPKCDYYEIPFGCLKVKGFENLLCTGRCISVSHAALGSTRVMGTCTSLGEQAGIAAANMIKHGNYLLSGNRI
ncbi:MAG: hypothetical protein CO147_00460 [Nitrospirae bacterium CG_4_9_14_3_um_filter_44_28]|nr:MAG: hypothetical protein CO147_00460 [Nitrospirae bacterium CG_4_9_14_3_um_filter_44_28]